MPILLHLHERSLQCGRVPVRTILRQWRMFNYCPCWMWRFPMHRSGWQGEASWRLQLPNVLRVHQRCLPGEPVRLRHVFAHRRSERCQLPLRETSNLSRLPMLELPKRRRSTLGGRSVMPTLFHLLEQRPDLRGGRVPVRTVLRTQWMFNYRTCWMRRLEM